MAQGAISEPVRVSGNFYRFDYDWFKVTLQAGRTYRFDLAPVIRVRGDGTYEVSLYPEIVALYDAESNYLQDTSDRESSGPGYVARVEFTPNADGAYYISAAGLGFTAGEYELTVSDITQEDDTRTADRSSPGRLSVGFSVTARSISSKTSTGSRSRSMPAPDSGSTWRDGRPAAAVCTTRGCAGSLMRTATRFPAPGMTTAAWV